MNNISHYEYYSHAKKNIEEKNYEKAKDNLLKCLDLKDSFEILNLLGVVYIHLKEYDNSIQVFENLLKKNLSNHSIHNNLGIAFKNKKYYIRAKEQFELSLKLHPKNHFSLFNLGNVFLELNQDDKAKKIFEECLKINKNYTPALLNLSVLYLNNKEFRKSLRLLDKCVELKNESLPVLENISKIHLLSKNFKKAEIYIKKIIKNHPNFLNKIFPLALGYVYQGESTKYKKICKFYNKQLESQISQINFNYNKTSKPLNLGFVGPDFRNHPIGFFLKDMLPELKKRINVSIFNTLNYQDDLSDFAKKYTNWMQCEELDDELLAELIYKKKIDILVDTSGMTRTNKLSVFKLKPVKTQISWAGWLASTNMKEIDYVVGDKFATPEKDDKNFSEKVYRIKDIWCTYSRSVLDDLGLKKKY